MSMLECRPPIGSQFYANSVCAISQFDGGSLSGNSGVARSEIQGGRPTERQEVALTHPDSTRRISAEKHVPSGSFLLEQI